MLDAVAQEPKPELTLDQIELCSRERRAVERAARGGARARACALASGGRETRARDARAWRRA